MFFQFDEAIRGFGTDFIAAEFPNKKTKWKTVKHYKIIRPGTHFVAF